MATGATFATGGRGCDGHPAQIAHNSWHPGFHPRAECARLEPPPEKFEPSVPSRRCTKVHIKPSIVVACPCPPISRPPRAISVQKTRRAGGHFKGHDETSPAQLAILSRLLPQLACYLCSIEALPSRRLLPLKSEFGAPGHHQPPLSGLVPFIRKNFRTTPAWLSVWSRWMASRRKHLMML